LCRPAAGDTSNIENSRLPYLWSYVLLRPVLDLRQLHAFVVLSEELHFGRAASRLGIAQPPLSQQIGRLERRIGHRLLTRGGGSPMRLTPAGRALLGAARAALSGLEAGLDAARRAARGESGFVRIGFTPSIALTVLPPIVQAFRVRFPLVELQLSELTSAEQIERVRTDRLDVALVRDPLPVADLPSHVLLEERLVVLLPCAHHLAGHRRVALASLAGEQFITVRASASSQYRQRFVLYCREAGFEPHIAQETGEWATVAGLVSSGMGVALAPASVAKIRLHGLVRRPLSQTASSSVVLFYQPEVAEAPAGQFIALSIGMREPGVR
jgi:DNA-binding transcriptional LysR family regulator